MSSLADDLRKKLDKLDKKSSLPSISLKKARLLLIPVILLILLAIIRPKCILYVDEKGEMRMSYKRLIILTLILSPFMYLGLWYTRVL